MRGVLTGFISLWALIALGYLIARRGLIGAEGTEVTARLVFFVAAPALLFTTLSRSEPAAVLTPALGVFVLSTVLVALGYLRVARYRWRREVGTATIGALCGSYVNAANLGLPVAAYVLGDVAVVAPVLLFQVLIAAPLALAVLDASTGQRPSLRRLAALPARNPIMLGCAAGLTVALIGWTPPAELSRPVELLGSAAVPLALISLGMSLPGSRPLAGGEEAPDRYLAVALKVLVQPALAYTIARFGFGLTGPTLLAAVVTAALPTAQNVFVFAARYRSGTALARDAVVLSTLAAAVPLALITLWLS